MRLKLLACKVMQREFSYLAAVNENTIDITYIRQGYHDEPATLQQVLQREIDAIDRGEDVHSRVDLPFDAILIGYGLCSNGVAGLRSEKYPLVIPKAHDCITLLLGSRERYDQLFHANSGGVYWYSPGWIENAPMPGKERYETLYAKYVEAYGEENADYLMEMEQGWMKDYSRLIYIDWPQLNFPRHREYAAKCAEYLNWNMDVEQGSAGLMQDFLSGNWDSRFACIPPGHTVVATNDAEIIKAGDNPRNA